MALGGHREHLPRNISTNRMDGAQPVHDRYSSHLVQSQGSCIALLLCILHFRFLQYGLLLRGF